jgi:hypothetical protein
MMRSSTNYTLFSSWPRRPPSTTTDRCLSDNAGMLLAERARLSVDTIGLIRVVDGRLCGHDEKGSVLAKARVEQFAISLHHRDCIESGHLSKSTSRMRTPRTSARFASNSAQVASSTEGNVARCRANLVPAPSPFSSTGAGSFAALSRISRTSASSLTPRASARRFSRTLTSSDTLRTRIWATCNTSDIMISKSPICYNSGANS